MKMNFVSKILTRVIKFHCIIYTNWKTHTVTNTTKILIQLMSMNFIWKTLTRVIKFDCIIYKNWGTLTVTNNTKILIQR